MLKKLLPPTATAAEFADDTLKIGTVTLKDRVLLCVLNWSDQPATISVPLPRAGQVTDLWSGHDYGRPKGALPVDLKAHEGTVLVVN
jgi:hypothetical protein